MNIILSTVVVEILIWYYIITESKQIVLSLTQHGTCLTISNIIPWYVIFKKKKTVI